MSSVGPPADGPLSAREGRDAESVAWGFAAHLKYSLGVDGYSTSMHDRFMSLALTVRDRMIKQWKQTLTTHYERGAKRVYYLSLEFLLGRLLANNVINLGLEHEVKEAMASLGYDWQDICEQEVDAGLGNGGL
ncbi:MAG TPA: glycogen phosphorylase, partial [Spirochaetia bacterium]|nr:glycogen phosphorylase [Spirochaetia bacterium]